MKKKFFIGLFVVAAIGLFVFAHLALKPTMPEYQPQQNIQAPIEIPNKSIMTYEDAEKIDKPMVLMFYVDWCGYCRKYMPIFGKFSEKYKDKYSFVAINCDKPQYTEMVKDFDVMGFPSLFILDKKIEHRFSLNMASTAYESVMQKELDRYIKVRKNFIK